MLIDNKRAIARFVQAHSDARVPAQEWLEKVEAASWRNFLEVRKTFNSADYVKPFVIFNIGGNNYRLLTEISYTSGVVQIFAVGTHAEYNKWKLK